MSQEMTFSSARSSGAAGVSTPLDRATTEQHQVALPLGLPAPAEAVEVPPAGRRAAGGGSGEAADDRSPHLLAARRLSRRIRRLRDDADAQTRTGLAICQHLRLLLAEEQGGAPRH